MTATAIDRIRRELRLRAAEGRARTMARVANRTFKKHPNLIDRLANAVVARVAGRD